MSCVTLVGYRADGAECVRFMTMAAPLDVFKVAAEALQLQLAKPLNIGEGGENNVSEDFRSEIFEYQSANVTFHRIIVLCSCTFANILIFQGPRFSTWQSVENVLLFAKKLNIALHCLELPCVFREGITILTL